MYLALLLALTVDTTVVWPGPTFFGYTCTTYLSTEYCASTEMTVAVNWGFVPPYGSYTPEQANSLWAPLAPSWNPLASLIHPTAFAFYVPFKVTPLEATVGESGWGGPIPFGNLPWAGYHLLAGLAVSSEERWWASGEGLETYVNSWIGWAEPGVPASMLWAWRAENEDGSIVLDCFQDPAGGDRCVTVTPEPATWALLLTGLLTLGIVAKRRGWRLSAPA